MKRLMCMVLLGVSLLPVASPGEQTAQATMWCFSVHLSQGAGPFGISSLNLTTDNARSMVNGELAPLFEDYSHWSYILMDDGSGFDPMEGLINLDVPSGVDENNDSFNDFFQVSQGISASTHGGFIIPGVVQGLVQVTWNRVAGSRSGVCVLDFGAMGSFRHTFTLLEYTGTMTYVSGGANVSGILNLKQTGDESQQIGGSVVFQKSQTNRFNSLAMQAGSWTNAAAQTLSFSANDFDRDSLLRTNYSGLMQFEDGYPDSYILDYQLWMFSINDANDSNHNGIPDFTDDARAIRAPKLSLARAGSDLLLNISGDIGSVCDILQTSSINSTNWQTLQSVTLTSDPQTIALPLDLQGCGFLRVGAQ